MGNLGGPGDRGQCLLPPSPVGNLGNQNRWGNQTRSEQFTACFSPHPPAPSRTRAAPNCARRLVVGTRRRPVIDQSTTVERRAENKAWCGASFRVLHRLGKRRRRRISGVHTPPSTFPPALIGAPERQKVYNAPTRPRYAAGSCQTATLRQPPAPVCRLCTPPAPPCAAPGATA